MIPMSPLLCYLIAMLSGKTKTKRYLFGRGFYLYGNDYYDNTDGKFSFIDAGVMLFCGLLFYKNHKEKILILVPIGFLLLYGIATGKESNQMVEKDAYLQLTDKDYSYTVDEILGQEEGLYRMEQAGTGKQIQQFKQIWSVESSIVLPYILPLITKRIRTLEKIFFK